MEGFYEVITASSRKPLSLIPQCGSCGRYRGCQSPKMHVGGRGEKKILIVTDAPGRNDDASGGHLTSEEGKYTRRALRGLGIDPDRDCWMTSAAICYSSSPVTGDVVNHCKPTIIQTIKDLEPNVVITLGPMPTNSIISHAWKEAAGELERWVGMQIPCQEFNTWICPNYDPKEVQKFEYKKALTSYFTHYLKEAVKLHKSKPFVKVPDYKSEIRQIYNNDEVIDEITSIRDDSTIAFDYECNALKPEANDAKIVSCAICVNGVSTFAFPFTRSVIPAFTSMLRNKKIHKVAANMKYEDRWTRVILNTEIKNWMWDTMLASHLIDGRSGITGLKFQAFAQLGQARYDLAIEPYLKTKSGGGNDINKVHKIPMKLLLEYNGMDALLEFKLMQKQLTEVR